MLSRLRLGRARSTEALGVLAAAAIIVAALVVTGRSLGDLTTMPPTETTVPAAPGPVGDGPYRIGDRAVCPISRPVLAASDGRSYPRGHPSRPAASTHAVACYDTVELATAAGYPPAPAPPGVVQVDSMYLIPVEAELRRECRAAADRHGFAVPCPTLLPMQSFNSTPPRVCEQQPPCDETATGFLFEYAGFVVPGGYGNGYLNTGARLVIGAARRPAAFAVTCADARPVAKATVRGASGQFLECPPGTGPHRGSVILRWKDRGTVVVMSVTGHTDLYRRLLLALAEHLELVAPNT